MKKVGIYNPYLETKGGGEKVCLALAAALSQAPGYQVELITHSQVDIPMLAQYFNINLDKVGLTLINFKSPFVKLLNRSPLPGRVRNFFMDLKTQRELKKHRYDIFVNNCYQSSLPNPSPVGVYMCMFPQRLAKNKELDWLRKVYFGIMAVMYRVFLHPAHQNGIFSYQVVTANSEYTKGFIKKFWGRDAEVLYPICEDMSQKTAGDKKKIILNVGRFFENSGENHHKRQDFLLQTFAGMKHLHEDGWELHFAGSTAEDVGALKYILSLIKGAENIPVSFHFNTSFKELKNLYNEASIYWHATGYGSDPEKHPEKQEHFGIVTVEAMSAGCVPVVINSAGQKESVQNGENGFLWNDAKQLADKTSAVTKLSPAERDRLATQARQTAKTFNNQAFNKRVVAFFDTL